VFLTSFVLIAFAAVGVGWALDVHGDRCVGAGLIVAAGSLAVAAMVAIRVVWRPHLSAGSPTIQNSGFPPTLFLWTSILWAAATVLTYLHTALECLR
jgi:hypothetical protein